MHSEPELVSLNCDPILAAYRPPSRTSLTAAGLDGSFQTPVVPAGGFWEFWSADESGQKPALRENTHTHQLMLYLNQQVDHRKNELRCMEHT